MFSVEKRLKRKKRNVRSKIGANDSLENNLPLEDGVDGGTVTTLTSQIAAMQLDSPSTEEVPRTSPNMTHYDSVIAFPDTLTISACSEQDESVVDDDDDEIASTVTSQITASQSAKEVPRTSPIRAQYTSGIEVPQTLAFSYFSEEQMHYLLTPPHVLKESFFYYNKLYFYLVIYEYAKHTGRCVGTCTLRFRPDDTRIKDFSPETLKQLELNKNDIWIRKRLK